MHSAFPELAVKNDGSDMSPLRISKYARIANVQPHRQRRQGSRAFSHLISVLPWLRVSVLIKSGQIRIGEICRPIYFLLNSIYFETNAIFSIDVPSCATLSACYSVTLPRYD